MRDPSCPFCGHDPYEYVDIGVGMMPVAVTCCEFGHAILCGKKPEEEIMLTLGDLRGFADRIDRYRTLASTREDLALAIENFLAGGFFDATEQEPKQWDFELETRLGDLRTALKEAREATNVHVY